MNLLSLRDNRLAEIPAELAKLRHLHVLDLSGNRLANLPCALLECDLKAIWLAENQAQPMLKFATDIDPNTGDKVLTCYLLPQQQYTSSSMGSFVARRTFQFDRFSLLENLLNPMKSGSTNQMRTSNPIDENESFHERTGSVKFADQADEAKEVRRATFLERTFSPSPSEFAATTQHAAPERSANVAKQSGEEISRHRWKSPSPRSPTSVPAECAPRLRSSLDFLHCSR